MAVQGIDGLGHLGIQFAQKFGYKVAAIGRGPENAVLAKRLGASIYIDSAAKNAAAAEKARRRTRDPGDIWEGTRRRERLGTVELLISP